jgi:hypothetical protein
MFVKRNSGAVLSTVVYKTGPKMYEQGLKMQARPDVFAPVLLLGETGYVMPALVETTNVAEALGRLRQLWAVHDPQAPLDGETRERHDLYQVAPLAAPSLAPALAVWRTKARYSIGRMVAKVHGDATLENIMATPEGRVVWIDPSTRPMPLEAEFDVAKLLQSYFGYGEGAASGARSVIKQFVRDEGFNHALMGYYLMTHLVRLHVVQPQARRWAERLACTLEYDMEELCK